MSRHASSRVALHYPVADPLATHRITVRLQVDQRLDLDDLALMEVFDEPAAVVERVTECHRTLYRRHSTAG